jgi:hypothetical protein
MPTIVDEDEPDSRSYHDGTQASTLGLSRASSRDVTYTYPDALPRESNTSIHTASQRSPSPPPQTVQEGWSSIGGAPDTDFDITRQPAALLQTSASVWESGAPLSLQQPTSQPWELREAEHKDTQVCWCYIIPQHIKTWMHWNGTDRASSVPCSFCLYL